MEFYLFLDIVCIVSTSLFLFFRCNLSFYHPAVWFLFYHIYNHTFRFISVYFGAQLLFSDLTSLKGASVDELIRAIFWADISLLCTAFFIVVAETFTTRYKPHIKVTYLNNKILWLVLAFSIPLGIYGALTQLYLPTFTVLSNIEQNSATVSSYDTIAQSWFGLSMLILIYFKGFKKRYIIPLIVYLIIIAIQGYFRYRLVLPLVFLTSTYLAFNNLKWPPLKYMVLAVFIAILFYPLKQIGLSLQRGEKLENIIGILQDSFQETASGNNVDQAFLDEYAITLTQLDEKDKFYYGTTLLPILISPIPRSVWPDKPALNQWQLDISSKYRPFNEMGSISSIFGESYANFGYIGIMLIPGLLFFFLTRWYNKIKLYPKRSVDFFIYLLIVSCLIQVMRDGLVSLFVFPVINNMPLFLIFILHKFFEKPQIIENVRRKKNNLHRNIAPSV